MPSLWTFSFLGLPSLPPAQPSIFSAIITKIAVFLQLNCLDRSMVISQDSRVIFLKYSSDCVIPVIHILSLCCDQSELFILKTLLVWPLPTFLTLFPILFSHLPVTPNYVWFLKCVLLIHVCLLSFLIHLVNISSPSQTVKFLISLGRVRWFLLCILCTLLLQCQQNICYVLEIQSSLLGSELLNNRDVVLVISFSSS